MEPNEGSEYVQDGLFDENNESTEGLDKSSKTFRKAIKDYNEYFGTNYDTSSESSNYYKDLSLGLKIEIDLLIVVNMFLTALMLHLNALWVVDVDIMD